MRLYDPWRVAAIALLSVIAFAIVTLFSGCQTLRFSFQSDFGSLHYELPQPHSTK
jgi:hypothetical protein